MQARTTPDSGSTLIFIAHLMDVSVGHEDEHLFPFVQVLTVVECDDHVCDCREHIDFTYGDEVITQDRFTIDELACLVWQLPQLVMACSDTQEHQEELAFQTEEGISVERIAPGVLALGFATDDSVKAHFPPGIAWQLVAELAALMVRRMVHTAGTVDQLEATLRQST
jgi:hypothetical protein